MELACIIPARFQSSRFPGKLLAKAGGKTVLQRTFESASRCKDLDALYVATDDERIASHVLSLGGEVIWTSSSCRSGTERVAEAVRSHTSLQKASYIVNLQGDHPCSEPETITAIAKVLQKDPEALLSTAVCKLESQEEFLSPHCVKCVFDAKENALYFSRSPIPYSPANYPFLAYGHIGVYCYRASFFLLDWATPTPLQDKEDLEQLRFLETGHKIKVAVVKERLCGIDTPQDLKRLEQLL